MTKRSTTVGHLSKTVASLLLFLGFAVPVLAQSAVVMPVPKIQFLDANGSPYASGKLYSYAAGTTTPLETCADSSLTAGACVTANLNPVILDTAGRASVFLRPAVYKFILQTSASVQVYSQDNVTSTTYLGSGTASTGTFLRGDYSWARPRTIVTSTAVGTQNNFDPGIVGDTVILENNATAVTITGFFPAITPWDGQKIWVISKGAGQVNLTPQSASSTAAYRLMNFMTVADTPLAAGSGTGSYVYDATTARWRLETHEQGAWIAYTPVWGNVGTANTTTGSTTTGRYHIDGTDVSFKIQFAFGTGTVGGSGAFTYTLPVTASAASVTAGTAIINDITTGSVAGAIQIFTTSTIVVFPGNALTSGVSATVPMTWSAANADSMWMAGFYEVP